MNAHIREDLLATPSPGGSWYRDFVQAGATRYWAGLARILLGFVFLWAFLDKNFGLEYSTAANQDWSFGSGDGDPTYGFLTFGTNPEGPFAQTFTDLRSSGMDPNHWTNWLFMAGLLGVGLTLILGIFMRIGAISGVVMLILMYLAESPWANTIDPETGQGAFTNPAIDDHIVYGVVLIMLMLFGAERTLGFGKIWESTGLVKRLPFLA